MYEVKMMFTLIQVGTNLWMNPVQIEGIAKNSDPYNKTQCPTIILVSQATGQQCSDWTFDKVKEALSSRAVSKAMESK